MRAPPLTFKRARNLRGQMTLPEVVLWEALRGGRLDGLRFRRQHPVGPYILDFYCPSARLAIEVDGSNHGHAERAARDASRDRWLAGRNVRVLRFEASDILKDDRLSDVLLTIAGAAAGPSTPPPMPPPVRYADHLPRFAGEEPEYADTPAITTGAREGTPRGTRHG